MVWFDNIELFARLIDMIEHFPNICEGKNESPINNICNNNVLQSIHDVWQTNCTARVGIYLIIARRTLHFWSSAKSTTAGSKDCESCLMPMT